MKIYKYPIMQVQEMIVDRPSFVTVKFPKESRGITTKLQRDTIVFYAAVNPDCTEMLEHTFAIVGTGYEMEGIDEDWLYIDTLLHEYSGLVSHVFWKGPDELKKLPESVASVVNIVVESES